MSEYNYPGYGRTRENWLTSRSNTVGGYHGGNDNPAEPGTPVYAQYGGEVFRSGNIKGYGMAVIVKSTAPDGMPFYQLYGHLGPGPLPAQGTPVAADQPIPGAMIGTKEYVQRMGGITSGPHLHREIISGKAQLNANPKEGLGIYSSDITYKADPDAFDVNHPVFPYQNKEPKPPPQPKNAGSVPPVTRPRPELAPRSGDEGSLPTQLAPGMAVPGAQGLTSIGGPNGPAPLLPPARSGAPAPARPAPPADPTLPPLHFAPKVPQNFGPFAVPGPFRSDVFGKPDVAPAEAGTRPSAPTPALDTSGTFAPAASAAASASAGPIGDGNGIGDWWGKLAPADSNIDPASVRRLSSPLLGIVPAGPNQSPRDAGPSPFAAVPSLPSPSREQSALEALLAPDGRGVAEDWTLPLPFRSFDPQTQDAPGGLPNLLMQVGAFDPSSPDQPPAGGLLGLIQDYMRNYPDGASKR